MRCILDMTESVSEEHLLEKVEPEYSPAAKASQIEGDVIFRITIGKDGVVKETHLGNPMLIKPLRKPCQNGGMRRSSSTENPWKWRRLLLFDFGLPRLTVESSWLLMLSGHFAH